MNIFKRAWLLFLRKMFYHQGNSSQEHIEMINETVTQLQELMTKSTSNDKIPMLDKILLPYGIPMGANKKGVLTHLGNFRISAHYDLSIPMGHLYKIYFIKMRFDRLCANTQFHLLNNQLYLAKTDFSTRLNSHQYESFLKGFIGTDHHPDKYTGIIIPYYMRDIQSNLLRIHNPLGYLSVIYYSGNRKLQTQVESILKQQIFN